MRNPFRIGGFERRLVIFFLLLSVPPTLIIAIFSARSFMQSVRLVSNPGVEQSFTNSMQIARDLSAKLEEDAGCAAARLREEHARDRGRAGGAAVQTVLRAVGEETHADFTAIYTFEGSAAGGVPGQGASATDEGTGSEAAGPAVSAAGEQAGSESAGGAGESGQGPDGDQKGGTSWTLAASYPAAFQRIDSRITLSPAPTLAPASSPASAPTLDEPNQGGGQTAAQDEAAPERAGVSAGERAAQVIVVPFSDPDVIARGTTAGGSLFVAGFALERGFAEKIRGTADDLGRYRAVGLYVNVMRRYIIIVTSVLVAIAAVASALLSRLIANRISHPITELARATERVAKGDLDYRVKVAARDEVLSLVNGFNKMTGELQENRQNLILAAKREAEVARDFQIARQVQESLFPTAMPLIPGWEFAATCRTAKQVGGDYYDVFEVGANKVLFAQGDVMGKSVGASLTMASVHAMIRSAGLSLGEKGTPARLVQELNRYLIGSKTPDMFVTLFIGLIDADRDKLWYVNCGHPPALLLSAAGDRPSELSVGGMVLGIMEETAFDTGECDLAVGDTLVLVSDGVTEAANPREEMYGDQPLVEVLSAGQGLGAIENMQRVLDSVDAFMEGSPQRDDISILVIRKAA